MRNARISILTLAASLALLPAGVAAQSGHDVTLHVDDRWKECSIQLDPQLTQAAWRQFVAEAGMVIYFRPLTGARPLGAGNWEVSVLQSQTGIDDTDPAWNDTFVHPHDTHWLFEGDGLTFPGLAVRAGVSSRVDVGAYFTKNVRANYGVAGAQVQVAALRDPASAWGAAARLGVSALFGPADVRFAVVGLDLIGSRRLDVSRWVSVTPYVGVSTIAAAGLERSAVVDLEAELVPGSQALAGAELRLGPARIAVEYNTATVRTRSARVGVAF